jgi:hypothetical protein
MGVVIGQKEKFGFGSLDLESGRNSGHGAGLPVICHHFCKNQKNQN